MLRRSREVYRVRITRRTIYALSSFPSMCPKIHLPRRFSLRARRRRNLLATNVHRPGPCRKHGRGRRRGPGDTAPGGVPATRGRECVYIPPAAVDRTAPAGAACDGRRRVFAAVARVGDSVVGLKTRPAATRLGKGTTSDRCDNRVGRAPFHIATVLAVVESAAHRTSTETAATSIALALLTPGMSGILDRSVTINQCIYRIYNVYSWMLCAL